MDNIDFSSYLEKYNYRYYKFNRDFYLYNFLNGDLFQINDSAKESFVKSKIQKTKKVTSSDNEIDSFILNGVPKMPLAEEVTPFHIQWHINENCNLRCKHCYQDKYMHHGLDLDRMKKIVDNYFIAINKWGNSPEFSITGGEPLLNPNLFPLLDYIKLKDKNTRIAILTNGTLITSEIAKKIKKRGVNLVQVSLEGSTRELNDDIRGRGTYDKILRAIKVLKSEKINTSVHIVLSEKNKKDVKNYIELAKKVGVDMLTFSNLVPFGSGEAMKDLLIAPQELKALYGLINREAEKLERLHKKPVIRRTRTLWCNFDESMCNSKIGGLCPVGLSTLTILSDGKVMPCRRMPIIIGDLTYQNFFEIWYGSEVLWKVRDKKKIAKCGKCKFLDKCGGCRGLAYVYFGDYLAPDPQCWLINKELGDSHARKSN